MISHRAVEEMLELWREILERRKWRDGNKELYDV